MSAPRISLGRTRVRGRLGRRRSTRAPTTSVRTRPGWPTTTRRLRARAQPPARPSRAITATGRQSAATKLSSYSYRVPVAKTETVVCPFTNTRNQGTIVIIKLTKGTAGATSFPFQTNPEPPYAHFSLASGGQNSQTLDTGAYTVKEL